MERRWIVLCIRLWITRTVFFNFRLEKYLYIWSYFFLFSQVIKNNGSKWRRWIIVIGNLEFNFWKWRVSFVIFLFSFYSTVPECNNCERIQYPSFATFWKQMEGKLALGSCIYRATFIWAFLFDLRTASRSDRVHRTKRFHEQKLVKWKIILVFFRLVFFSFFRWNTSNSWNLNDRCATAQLSRAQTVGNSWLTHILCLVAVAKKTEREREKRNVVNRNNYFNLLSTASPLYTSEEYLGIFLSYSNNSKQSF